MLYYHFRFIFHISVFPRRPVRCGVAVKAVCLFVYGLKSYSLSGRSRIPSNVVSFAKEYEDFRTDTSPSIQFLFFSLFTLRWFITEANYHYSHLPLQPVDSLDETIVSIPTSTFHLNIPPTAQNKNWKVIPIKRACGLRRNLLVYHRAITQTRVKLSPNKLRGRTQGLPISPLRLGQSAQLKLGGGISMGQETGKVLKSTCNQCIEFTVGYTTLRSD